MDCEFLKNILKKISGSRIAVIGDFCLDAYWRIDPAQVELSLETGKPTQRVKSQRYQLGGAANVVNNLAALEPERIFTIGVIGDDLFGREIERLLLELPACAGGLIVQQDLWDTPVFGKPYYGDEEQRRIDFGMHNVISSETERRLTARLREIISKVQAVVINRQLDNSIYSENIIKEINRLIAKYRNKYFVIDSRQNNDAFRGGYLKLNQAETCKLANGASRSPRKKEFERLIKCAEKIKLKTESKAVIVTRGQKGMLVYNGQDATEIPGIQILDRVDPVGAGDTVTSTLTACLAAGAEVKTASEIANYAATVTVRKLFQCGTASKKEILDACKEAHYIYNIELAEDVSLAKYLPETGIEIINPAIEKSNIRHIIFDNDGTISTLRQGWEPVMEKVMVHVILGAKYQNTETDLRQTVLTRVKEYIDQSTGIQTLAQMKQLVKMVKEFGFVPHAEILDEFGYKEIYNRALMEIVEKRIKQIQAGQKSAADFRIKNAFAFLENLYHKNITLYLASGTDVADVIREARILGYAEFFGNRIYGAVGDINKCSKKLVVAKIIRENKLTKSRLCCFGDGPVELFETRKSGGVAVGVASNEVKRSGLNKEKRSRLIKAGADIIVSDFLESGALLNFLLIKR